MQVPDICKVEELSASKKDFWQILLKVERAAITEA